MSKVSKYGVFSDPYFPVFSVNAGKYGPENTSYLDTSHSENALVSSNEFQRCSTILRVIPWKSGHEGLKNSLIDPIFIYVIPYAHL